MRGTDFIQAIIDSVEKVKNSLATYSRSGSNSSIGKQEPEFEKTKVSHLPRQFPACFYQVKLRPTKDTSSSGWRLDPYKERGVAGAGGASGLQRGGTSNRSSSKKKKKKKEM